MAEEKVIITSTTFRSELNKIFIKSEYLSGTLPNTISAFIGDSIGNSNSVSYIEGELMIQMENYPSMIDYTINNNGQLIVSTSTGDSTNYSINSDGDLIWFGEDNS